MLDDLLALVHSSGLFRHLGTSVSPARSPDVLFVCVPVQPSSPPRERIKVAAVRGAIEQMPRPWRRVPRSGSIIGTRLSVSSPTSNTSESQLAATKRVRIASDAVAPEVGAGVRSGGWVTARSTASIVEQSPHPAGCDQPVVEPLRRVHVVVLQIEDDGAFGSIPIEHRPRDPRKPLRIWSFAVQSSRSAVDSGSRSSVGQGSPPRRSRTPSYAGSRSTARLYLVAHSRYCHWASIAVIDDSVRHLDAMAQRGVVADRPHLTHRIGQSEGFGKSSVLERAEYQGRRSRTSGTSGIR